MKAVKSVVIMVLGVLALCVVGVASASAHEFISTASGEGTVVQNGSQVLKIPLGKITCERVTHIKGTVTAGKEPSIELSLSYLGCTYSVLGGLVEGEALVSLADYTIFASKLVSILKPILIDFHGALAACSISIPVQSVGGKEGEIEFNNKSGKILQQNNVKEITYSVLNVGTESCADKTGEEKNAEYKGSIEAGVEGGSVEWK